MSRGDFPGTPLSPGTSSTVANVASGSHFFGPASPASVPLLPLLEPPLLDAPLDPLDDDAFASPLLLPPPLLELLLDESGSSPTHAATRPRGTISAAEARAS